MGTSEVGGRAKQTVRRTSEAAEKDSKATGKISKAAGRVSEGIWDGFWKKNRKTN